MKIIFCGGIAAVVAAWERARCVKDGALRGLGGETFGQKWRLGILWPTNRKVDVADDLDGGYPVNVVLEVRVPRGRGPLRVHRRLPLLGRVQNMLYQEVCCDELAVAAATCT